MDPISQFYILSPRGDTIITRDCTCGRGSLLGVGGCVSVTLCALFVCASCFCAAQSVSTFQKARTRYFSATSSSGTASSRMLLQFLYVRFLCVVYSGP